MIMTMIRRLLPVAVIALLLTGCAGAQVPTVKEDDGCLELSAGATKALQDGLDNKGAGYTITQAAAIEDGDAWWVAADLDGTPAVTAVWYTTTNPTVDGDNAYLSATKLASLTSTYLMPEDLTGSEPINTAEACLNN